MAHRRASRALRTLQSPQSVSNVVLGVGIITLLGVFAPDLARRTDLVEDMVPDVFPAAATTGSLAIGVILLVLARSLRRGKHRAWVIATVLVAMDTVFQVVRALSLVEALLCALLTALLTSARRNFAARPDPRSRLRLLAVVLLGPVVATGLGYGWLAIVTRGQLADTTGAERLLQALLGLAGIPGPIDFVSDIAAARSAVGLAVLGAALLLVALLVAVQPADGPHHLTDDEEGRVRGLLAKWGWVDSLSYYGTRGDRAVIVRPCGQAAMSYRVVGSTSLSAGDPVGNPSAWPGAIGAWLDEARSYGWTPANLGSSERGATALCKAGLNVLELGDEAIVHLSEFSLEGRSMRGVRQAVARTRRAGVTADCVRVKDLAAETLELVRERADAWREGEVERGFSMALGRFGDPADGDALLVLARDADGDLVGLLHFVPWGDDALSLDLMRRSRDSENGVIVLMVATLCQCAPDLGISKISLNFAVFRSVFAHGERLGAGPYVRAWRAVLLWASRFAQIESLYRANAKYHPEWAPRFIAYEGPSDIPTVATAALRAEAFLALPTWLRLPGHTAPEIRPDLPAAEPEVTRPAPGRASAVRR